MKFDFTQLLTYMIVTRNGEIFSYDKKEILYIYEKPRKDE